MLRVLRSAAVLLAVAAGHASSQSTPEELASRIAERWVAGPQSDFDKLFPFAKGRKAFSEATQRIRGLDKVVRKSSGAAILLLSGISALPNSGDATLEGIGYSGVYRARFSSLGWELEAPVPLDDLGRISSQSLTVKVRPGAGILVEDRMRVAVKGANGFAVRLNHAAKLEAVRLGAGGLGHIFGGGLLWMDLPAGESEVTLRYALEVPADPKTSNSACFLEASGHLRNQFLWHPLFGFDATGDWASFEVEVRIPAKYQLSTSLPQSEHLEAGERVIRGHTPARAFALSLVYDRDWAVTRRRCEKVDLEIRLVPGTSPDAAAIGNEFCILYGLLSRRFGRPAGNLFGAVQARSWQENAGWRFASNSVVVAAATPGVTTLNGPYPAAPLGHEVAHLWSEGVTGPEAAFLAEGWAVWVEALALAADLGPVAVQTFWKNRSGLYFLDSDGKGTLLDQPPNSSIAYFKGPWIYRMLEEAIGVEGFDRAMAEYWAAQSLRRQGWEDLANTVQKHAPRGFDARQFLLPWVTGMHAPEVAAEVKDQSVTIHVQPEGFILPVTLEVTTIAGLERRRIWMRGTAATVTFPSAVSAVKVDPDGLLLIH